MILQINLNSPPPSGGGLILKEKKMSKKGSNPPPKGAVKPLPPPAPPESRILRPEALRKLLAPYAEGFAKVVTQLLAEEAAQAARLPRAHRPEPGPAPEYPEPSQGAVPVPKRQEGMKATFEALYSGESDPNGLAASAPGAKLDAGKPRASLLKQFGLALLEVAKVATGGAAKYSAGGWQFVEDGIERYDNAKWRHALTEHYQPIDPDFGLLHAAHEAWDALAKLELMCRERDGIVIAPPPMPPTAEETHL